MLGSVSSRCSAMSPRRVLPPIRNVGSSPNSGWIPSLGACSTGKNRNLRSSNCWKCIEILNATITTLCLYHFKFFTTHKAYLFRSWGGGGCVRTPPAYGPNLYSSSAIMADERDNIAVLHEFWVNIKPRLPSI